MFEKAKQLREAVREEYKQKSVDPYTENIFKGKIFCAHCGKPLHRCRKKCKTRLDTYSFYCLANSRIDPLTTDIIEQLNIFTTTEKEILLKHLKLSNALKSGETTTV